MPGGRSRLSRKHWFSAWVVAVVDHPSRRVRRFHCPPPPLAIVAEEPATLSVIRPPVLVVAPVPETSCLLVFVFGPLLGPRRRRLRRGESIHDVCHCIHVVPDRRQVTQSARGHRNSRQHVGTDLLLLANEFQLANLVANLVAGASHNVVHVDETTGHDLLPSSERLYRPHAAHCPPMPGTEV